MSREREEMLRASPTRGRAAEVVADRVRRITGRPEGAFRVVVESGPPHAAMVRLAERLEAERIVAGSHGLTGLTRMLIGSVALSIVRHAHCPVLVARPRPRSEQILVGTDFSDEVVRSLKAADSPVLRIDRGGRRLRILLRNPQEPAERTPD